MIKIPADLQEVLKELALAPHKRLSVTLNTLIKLEALLIKQHSNYATVYDEMFEKTENDLMDDIANNFGDAILEDSRNADDIYLYYGMPLIGMLVSMNIEALQPKHEDETYLEEIIWAIQSLRTVVKFININGKIRLSVRAL